MKKVYRYGDDGKYLGEIILDASDCSPSGIFNIPANCSDKEPPSFDASKQTLKWSNGAWVLADIPADPVIEPTIAEIKQKKVAALNANYDSRFTELSESFGLATLANDTALIAELRTEYTDLKTAYAVELEAIKNG